MSQVPLSPPPPSGDGIFDRWMYLLWRRLTQSGQILWGVIDKSGSNITDIETRNHADLQNINTASYYHLTQTDHTDLTDGGATTLHKHDHGTLDGLADDDHAQYVLVTNLEADRATIVTNWDDLTDAGQTSLHKHDHAAQDNLNSTNYYHLTQADHTDLTDGGLTTLHQHDFNNIQYPASLKVGDPTHVDTLQEVHNHSFSAGVMHGCNITDNGDGTVSFSTGYAMLRAVADPHTSLYAIAVPAQANLALTDNATNYIYLDWNAGSPQFATSTSISSFNCMDKCIAYMAYRQGTAIHTIDAREQNVDGNRRSRQLFLNFARFIHAQGGSVLGASGLYITLTEGSFYFMLQALPHDAFDTTVAGTANANVFTLWYRDGLGSWVETLDQKQVSTTLYDDGSGTPATLGNNKYGVTWFYVMNDSPSELHAVMGQVEYANAADAKAAAVPSSIPGILSGLGSLVGFVTYEKSAIGFTEVLSAFATVFASSAATAHNGLAGLQGGALGEYYHLTSANYTDLTDGGDSTLHYHASDRDRANHTGTQAAATISDFDTEVSNNTDVAANTAARHVAVTVTDSTSINLTLVGQDVTAEAIFGTSSGTVAEGNHAHSGLYQPLDSDLTAIAGLSLTANQVLGKDAAGTGWEGKTITAGTGINVTHGANSITITNTGSGVTPDVYAFAAAHG